MKEQPLTDAMLRQFLLGEVDDEVREHIESLFLTDEAARDRVLGAEQDLIEEYLDDSLSAADREKFLAQYGATPQLRRKLRIAETIHDWTTSEANVNTAAPVSESWWDRLRARMRFRAVYAVPISVAAMILIVVAAVWINRVREHRSVELELARLNATSNLRADLPQMLSLELSPVAVRSVEQGAEFEPSASVQVVQLRLLWIQQERYTRYRAVIRRFDGGEPYTVPELYPENEAGHAIRLRLPSDMLTRGLYQIILSGVAADGSVGTTEEYKLSVGG